MPPNKRNKQKRKHEEACMSSDEDTTTLPPPKESKITPEEMNIPTNENEQLLFEKMNHVNGELISLAKQVKLVGHKYFINNSVMIDEFMSNVQEFMKEVDVHRKRVSSEQINPDDLFYIFQFLNSTDLATSCQLVCQMWREAVKRVKLKIVLGDRFRPTNKAKLHPSLLKSLVNGSLIHNVTSLRLCKVSAESISVLTNCKNLQNLTELSLEGNVLGVQGARYLKNCSGMDNLTCLNLSKAQKLGTKEATDILSSKMLEKVKLLNLSNLFPGDFLAKLSSNTILNEVTHLKLNSYYGTNVSGLESFLHDKTNLEYLSVRSHNLSSCTKLFTDGNLFKNLTFLDVSYTKISNQTLLDIVVSSQFANLTTLIVERNDSEDKVKAPQDPNQSNLTELDLRFSNNLENISLITHYCPKLKILNISYSNSNAYQLLNSSSLSCLEYLNMENTNCNIPLFELIFTCPTFSNLKYLDCGGQGYNETVSEIVEHCTNLTNLRLLRGGLINKASFSKNPNFSKVVFGAEILYPRIDYGLF